MPDLLRLLPVGFALGACGTVIDAGIGSGIGTGIGTGIGPGGGRGIMLPMSQPDPGSSA
jgi:hypothetical protein